MEKEQDEIVLKEIERQQNNKHFCNKCSVVFKIQMLRNWVSKSMNRTWQT